MRLRCGTFRKPLGAVFLPIASCRIRLLKRERPQKNTTPPYFFVLKAAESPPIFCKNGALLGQRHSGKGLKIVIFNLYYMEGEYYIYINRLYYINIYIKYIYI